MPSPAEGSLFFDYDSVSACGINKGLLLGGLPLRLLLCSLPISAHALKEWFQVGHITTRGSVTILPTLDSSSLISTLGNS